MGQLGGIRDDVVVPGGGGDLQMAEAQLPEQIPDLLHTIADAAQRIDLQVHPLHLLQRVLMRHDAIVYGVDEIIPECVQAAAGADGAVQLAHAACRRIARIGKQLFIGRLPLAVEP